MLLLRHHSQFINVIVQEPLERRRQLLAEAMKGKADPIALSESLNANVSELVRVAKEFGFEGIVAKRKNPIYESGKRTGAWVKYKVNRGQELVIGGYTPGNPFDALIVGYYEGGKLLYADKVRNGFVPLVRRADQDKLRLALQLMADSDEPLFRGPLLFIIGSFARNDVLFGPRGYRRTLLEAGHVAQEVVHQAERLGRVARPLYEFIDRDVDAVMEADGIEQGTIMAFELGGAIDVG